MSAQAIDFTSPGQLYASILAANGGSLAFRGGAQTVINAWTPISAWQFPAYVATQIYQAGQQVEFFNLHYTCEVNGTVGVTPGGEPSFYWTLNQNQPQMVSGLNTTDDAPAQAYLPWAPPAGVSLTARAFTESGLLGAAIVTITSGVMFQAPGDLTMLFITAGTSLPWITGTNNV